MKFILQRYSDNRKCTTGMLFQVSSSEGKDYPYFLCYTLEDEYREVKVKSETRIPAGIYKLGIQPADTPLTVKYQKKFDWFKKHIEILNVPGFTGIYIHIGNSEFDTAGCVLVGDSIDNNHKGGGNLSHSTDAYKRFYSEFYENIEEGECEIEIRDEKTLL